MFEAGDLALQSGQVLANAKLVYQTHGALNARRDNAIIVPTHYGGQHTDNAWMISPHMAISPEEYFVIVPNMLGNGLSSSPSNAAGAQSGARFPAATVYDNIILQHRLVAGHLGIEKVKLVAGYSMGAQQAFHWAAMFPQMVERIAPICGSARTSRHNFLFLEGIRAALTADAAFRDGQYAEAPVRGIRAMARVYAGWAWSQTFFRESLDLTRFGFASMEDFLINLWEPAFQQRDANDLLAMLQTWQAADISAAHPFAGEFEQALGAITAKAIVMPSQTDLYFPPEDSEIEVAHMPNAELRVIPSIWGHMAGGGVNPEDAMFINDALKDLLAG